MIETFKSGTLLKWNTSVSDHCCHHCDGVVYKADSVIDTIHHEDDCKTIESSVCKILPGKQKYNMYYISVFVLLGHDKALMESEFSYKNCCNDERGIHFITITFKRLCLCVCAY